MRIISKERDYYDTVQAHGQDQSLVWVRKEKTEYFKNQYYTNNGEEYPFPLLCRPGYYTHWEHKGLDAEQYMVGFCGKIYPVVNISSLGRGGSRCYCIEDIDAFVDEKMDDKHKKKYYKPEKSKFCTYECNNLANRVTYKRYFDECEQKKSQYSQMFIDHKSPIFLAEESDGFMRITYDAILKEVCFYQKFDAYQAFQEISMYYGGVLSNVNEVIPEVSDKDMIEAKGFDKFSFRKSPGKRRKRKKK